MVKEVNVSELKPEEILSNRVFEINPLTHKLQIAQPMIEKEVAELKQPKMAMHM